MRLHCVGGRYQLTGEAPLETGKVLNQPPWVSSSMGRGASHRAQLQSPCKFLSSSEGLILHPPPTSPRASRLPHSGSASCLTTNSSLFATFLASFLASCSLASLLPSRIRLVYLVERAFLLSTLSRRTLERIEERGNRCLQSSVWRGDLGEEPDIFLGHQPQRLPRVNLIVLLLVLLLDAFCRVHVYQNGLEVLFEGRGYVLGLAGNVL
mmetsp:Transcript_20387/g.41457  ORF Transcript_20387/g.41457 Transcript_20387/m.41457 type:complete len:209 (-) Transcript_20387:483-1109(-)